MPKAKQSSFYAVRAGRERGVFRTWSECEASVSGYPNAKYKKFPTRAEAEAFVSNDQRLKVQVRKYLSLFEITLSLLIITVLIDANDAALRTSAANNVEALEQPKPTDIKTATAASDNSNTSETTTSCIIVYTDGASSNNGRGSAMAGVGVFFGPNDPRNVSERLAGPRQSNQRAEITAVIRALEKCGRDDSPIEVRTDSTYVINACTKWYKTWRKNNWQTAEKKPVENKDLFEKLLRLIESRPGPVKWMHVRGHSGNYGNEMADQLAVLGARMPAVVGTSDLNKTASLV